MSNVRHFDDSKGLEALLYVSERCANMYNALKVLYFADKEHLSKYGRSICDDRYVAMSHGPVPSGAYDMVKIARGDSLLTSSRVTDAISVQGHGLIPLRKPNLDFLSDSDKECLDNAIAQYGHLPFPVLEALSHKESAFKAADENDFISDEALVKSLADGKLLWDFLTAG